jgi:hypothetical protein
MGWKPEPDERAAAPVPPQRENALRDGISADLQVRGVVAPAAEALAGHLVRQLDGRDHERAVLLDGVALGFCAQDAVAEQLARSAGELQEIERLMSSFAGELSKLDEVLEVLAAYLRRMRTASPLSSARLLH